MAPEGFAGMAGGEVEADAVGQFADAAGDLEEAEAEGVELVVSRLGPGKPAAQGVEEPIGRQMQEQAEVVGPEAMVAEAVGLESDLEALDRAVLSGTRPT